MGKRASVRLVSCLGRLAAGVLVAALVLATALPPLAAGSPSDLVAPTLLLPAQNQIFTAGTHMVFRVGANAGEDSSFLWLHVSRSPAIADPCGTIGFDAEIEPFHVTSDPTVFEATPTFFDYSGFWMNTPGTYYWQAHRIHHGDGADGCIESETRSFTIKGAPTTPAPVPTTPAPVPTTPKPKPRSLRVARLTGDFDMKERVTSSHNFSTRVGSTNESTWTFAPLCRRGACSVRLTLYYGILGADKLRVRLARSGTVYSGSGTGHVASCSSADVRGTLSVRLRVAKGAWTGTTWRATGVVGTFRISAPGTVFGLTRCPAGWVTRSIRGTLAR